MKHIKSDGIQAKELWVISEKYKLRNQRSCNHIQWKERIIWWLVNGTIINFVQNSKSIYPIMICFEVDSWTLNEILYLVWVGCQIIREPLIDFTYVSDKVGHFLWEWACSQQITWKWDSTRLLGAEFQSLCQRLNYYCHGPWLPLKCNTAYLTLKGYHTCP